MSEQAHPRERYCAVEALENRCLMSVDLTGTFGKLPLALPPGGMARIAVKVSNEGSDSIAGPADVRIYASSDGVLGMDDLLIGEADKPHAPRAGATQNIMVRFHLPTSLPDGNYFLLGTVTAPNAHGSSAPFVFASSAPVKIAQPFVDIVTLFSQTPQQAIKTNGLASTERFATVQLVNLGNVPARGTESVNLYLSNGAVLDGSATMAARSATVHVNIRPGGAQRLSRRVVLPDGTLPGSYKLFAVATPIIGAAPRERADTVAAEAGQVQVISLVPNDVLAANYARHHHKCVYYDGSNYCADDEAVYGQDAAVFAGTTVPADFSPPSAGNNPGTQPSSQPATEPGGASWGSGLPDATAAAASDDNSDSGGDSGSSGDSSGGDDGGDSGGGDDDGDD